MNNFKKQINEKIKLYSNEEYLDEYIKNEFLTDDGYANIILNLRNRDDLFDYRTTGKQLDLDKSIYRYLEEKASMLNADEKLKLNIICDFLNNDEKEKVTHIIKEHYAIELYKIQKEYKRNMIKIFRLLLLGLLFLIIYALIAYNTKSKLFIEIFGFLFSFTLWEAFEYLIYDLSDIKRQRKSITEKLLMEIEFTNIK